MVATVQTLLACATVALHIVVPQHIGLIHGTLPIAEVGRLSVTNRDAEAAAAVDEKAHERVSDGLWKPKRRG